MHPIKKRQNPVADWFAPTAYGTIRSKAAIKESIELCRKTDILIMRLNDKVDPLAPTNRGTPDRFIDIPIPESWTKESIIKLIRNRR